VRQKNIIRSRSAAIAEKQPVVLTFFTVSNGSLLLILLFVLTQDFRTSITRRSFRALRVGVYLRVQSCTVVFLWGTSYSPFQTLLL